MISKRYLMGFFISLLMWAQADNATSLNELSASLETKITQANLNHHLETFQAIADQHNGNRSAGSAGYDASANYVKEQLERAGYVVTEQSFDLTGRLALNVTLDQLAPEAIKYNFGPDVRSMQFSAEGQVKAIAQPVDVLLPPKANNSSTSACEASDFDGFQAGNIALVQRGVCTFQDKVDNALNAGASAVIIFNEGQAGRRDLFGGTLSEQSKIPVLIATFEIGESLAKTEPMLELTVSSPAENLSTTNIIAESQTGDPKNVIMLGAHLDSVPEGPGIHDNASGSSATLEVALQLAETLNINDAENTKLQKKVRFAWWGGEELGLLGSRHYLNELTKREKDAINAYINLDMVGSPNYARFIYDGDESDKNSRLSIPNGSGAIEELFISYFESQNLNASPAPIFQGSDHSPFTQENIPIGGLYTGASETKTKQYAELYGGQEGEPLDACYHQACDNIDNINLEVLEQMTDATAHVILRLLSQENLLEE